MEFFIFHIWKPRYRFSSMKYGVHYLKIQKKFLHETFKYLCYIYDYLCAHFPKWYMELSVNYLYFHILNISMGLICLESQM